MSHIADNGSNADVSDDDVISHGGSGGEKAVDLVGLVQLPVLQHIEIECCFCVTARHHISVTA